MRARSTKNGGRQLAGTESVRVVAVVPQHLAPTPAQDEVLAHLAGNSRCSTPRLQNSTWRWCRREKRKRPPDAASGVIEVCRAPDEVIGGEPIDPPV